VESRSVHYEWLLILAVLVSMLVAPSAAVASPLAQAQRRSTFGLAQSPGTRLVNPAAALETAPLSEPAADSPVFFARPNYLGVYHETVVGGWGWIPGQIVRTDTDWDNDGVTDYTSLFTPDSDGYFEAWGQIGGGLLPGWTVTASQGSTSKTLTIADMVVTSVDPDADTVSGTAEPGSEVEVFAWDYSGTSDDPGRTVSANSEGVWIANFKVPAVPGSGNPYEDRAWDIGYSSDGSVYQSDGDGDMTADFWEQRLASPRPVYRFRNLKNGFYLWSADAAERAYINANLTATWKEEGEAYAVDPDLNKSTLMRFRNIQGGYYLYSADPAEWAYINANLSRTWVQEGPAYGVSRTPVANGPVVWRFRNLINGTYLYSADPDERDVINEELYGTWREEGEAYFLRY